MKADREFLRELEEKLNPARPEESGVRIRILGYGEISTVFEVDDFEGVAFKRIPMFESEQKAEEYIDLFHEYTSLLRRAGLNVPESSAEYVVTGDDRIVVFLMQRKLDPESICNRIAQRADSGTILDMFSKILLELEKVWEFNELQSEVAIGIDGQISNWALENEGLVYFDTSTPMVRKNGVDMIDPEVFLRACPPVARTMLRLFFLQDILDRYYDFRLVVLDLIANMFKEGRDDVIPEMVSTANTFFSERGYGFAPITVGEVRKYYKSDAFIWELYLRLRRAHRFVITSVLRRRYDYILPGKIKR